MLLWKLLCIVILAATFQETTAEERMNSDNIDSVVYKNGYYSDIFNSVAYQNWYMSSGLEMKIAQQRWKERWKQLETQYRDQGLEKKYVIEFPHRPNPSEMSFCKKIFSGNTLYCGEGISWCKIWTRVVRTSMIYMVMVPVFVTIRLVYHVLRSSLKCGSKKTSKKNVPAITDVESNLENEPSLAVAVPKKDSIFKWIKKSKKTSKKNVAAITDVESNLENEPSLAVAVPKKDSIFKWIKK